MDEMTPETIVEATAPSPGILEEKIEELAGSVAPDAIKDAAAAAEEPKSKVWVRFKIRNKHNEVKGEDAMIFSLTVDDLRYEQDLAVITKNLEERGYKNPLIVDWTPLEG